MTVASLAKEKRLFSWGKKYQSLTLRDHWPASHSAQGVTHPSDTPSLWHLNMSSPQRTIYIIQNQATNISTVAEWFENKDWLDAYTQLWKGRDTMHWQWRYKVEPCTDNHLNSHNIPILTVSRLHTVGDISLSITVWAAIILLHKKVSLQGGSRRFAQTPLLASKRFYTTPTAIRFNCPTVCEVVH